MDKLSNECTKIRRFMKVEASSPKDLALRNLKLKEAEIQKRKSDIVGKIIAEEERERKSKLASRSIPTNRKPSKTDIVEDIEKLKEPDLFIKEKVLENASSSEIDNIISTQQTFQTEKKHLPPPNIKPIKKPEQSIKIVSKSIFTFTPTQVIFKDYEPGKKYSQKVNLTNTSGFQNSYRLVNLSEELQDYFEVVFVPPGKMSAGTTRSMTILFTPTIDFNQDLQGHVLLVAEHGGEFTIPLICLKQDCIPRLVDGNLLSFGDCVVDGYLKRNIILENIGSLSASYSIENIDQKEDSCFSITDRNGLLNGYSTNSIQVDFKSSKTTGKISEKFRIVFKDVTQLEFTAECNIFDVPVHASINVVDFKTCVIGNLYREVVSLENSGSSALKFEIKVQKEHLQYILVRDPNVTKLGQASSGSLVLRIPNVGDIEILPRMAYIQPRNTFPLRFKFSPAGKSSEIDFALPVLIAYKAFGLDCVIKLDMKGSLTSNELTFELEGGDKSVLNFGISSILEMSQKSLKISNMSHLPQTLKFKSDSSALLLDSSTDIIVGARDSLQICLNFAPQEAQKHNIKFNFESNMKKLYEFRAVGKGIFPLLKFNYNNIEFEPTAIGSFANQKVLIVLII